MMFWVARILRMSRGLRTGRRRCLNGTASAVQSAGSIIRREGDVMWRAKYPALLLLLVLPTGYIAAQADRFYGEPVELRGNFIYFASWKYVRQGSFAWQIDVAPDATDAEKNVGAWLKGDGGRPARFESWDMPQGIRLVAQKAEKVPFQPGQMAATLFDEGKYKAWYTMGPCAEEEPFSTKDMILPGHNAHLCYAESEDGMHWTVPNLGLFEYAGSRKNNLVFRGDLNGSTRGMHTVCVFVDPTSAEERYKMLYLGIITDEEWEAFAAQYPDEVDTMARRNDVGGYRCVMGVFGAVSPDGIHWESLPAPLMVQHADTHNTCYYDEDRQEYVAYVRGWQVNAKAAGYELQNIDNWIGVGRRSIGRAVSKDYRHFEKTELVVSTGADMPPSHLFYTNGKTTLPGAPDNHVMLPWVWELERDGGSVCLWSSADGTVWSRVPGGPVVSPGALGTSDGGFVVCTGNLLEYQGDRWCMPYSATPIPHKYPGRDCEQRTGLFPGVPGVSGLATWTRGRLVALECDEKGQFATVAVIPRGNRIRLNAIVHPTGYIRTALRRMNHAELPGRTFVESDRIIGDSLAVPVTWAGEAEMNHGGEPIILHFRMCRASLFAVEFY